jgi:hypothetical protein
VTEPTSPRAPKPVKILVKMMMPVMVTLLKILSLKGPAKWSDSDGWTEMGKKVKAICLD